MSRIIFMGTPDFAVPALHAIHEAFGVDAVVTVPDKPQGRGRRIVPSAVKTAAESLGITTILQPTRLKDPVFIEQVAEQQPDIICVIAFRILPRAVYSIARLGAFNVHGSLLPKFRGAAPINHAIMNGELESGVTSFLLNDVVDTGNVLIKKRFSIPDGTTAGELYASLMPLAAECAVETCRGLIEGTLTAMAQDESQASPAPKVFRDTARVNWSGQTKEIRQYILGHSPAPCAWTMWNGDVLKIFRASVSNVPCNAGKVRIVDGELIVGCADGSLRLDEIQLPNKRRMAVSDIMNGYRGPMEGIVE